TQGDYYTSKTFATDWANAKGAGVLRSAYHFFDPTVDGVAQANHFLAQLGADQGELPAMLDLECPVSSSQAVASQPNNTCCEYGTAWSGNTCTAGNSGWAPAATIVQRALDWLNTV